MTQKEEIRDRIKNQGLLPLQLTINPLQQVLEEILDLIDKQSEEIKEMNQAKADKKDLASLGDEVKNNKTEVDEKLESTQKLISEKAAELQDQITENQNQSDAKFLEANSRIDQSEAAIADLNKSIAELASKLDEINAKQDKMQNVVEDHEDRIANLESRKVPQESANAIASESAAGNEGKSASSKPDSAKNDNQTSSQPQTASAQEQMRGDNSNANEIEELKRLINKNSDRIASNSDRILALENRNYGNGNDNDNNKEMDNSLNQQNDGNKSGYQEEKSAANTSDSHAKQGDNSQARPGDNSAIEGLTIEIRNIGRRVGSAESSIAAIERQLRDKANVVDKSFRPGEHISSSDNANGMNAQQQNGARLGQEGIPEQPSGNKEEHTRPRRKFGANKLFNQASDEAGQNDNMNGNDNKSGFGQDGAGSGPGYGQGNGTSGYGQNGFGSGQNGPSGSGQGAFGSSGNGSNQNGASGQSGIGSNQNGASGLGQGGIGSGQNGMSGITSQNGASGFGQSGFGSNQNGSDNQNMSHDDNAVRPPSGGAVKHTPRNTNLMSLPDLNSPDASEALAQLRNELTTLTQRLQNNEQATNDELKRIARDLADRPDRALLERLFEKFKTSLNGVVQMVENKEQGDGKFATIDDIHRVETMVKNITQEFDEAAACRKCTKCLSCGMGYRTTAGSIQDPETMSILGAAPISSVAQDVGKPTFVYGSDNELYYSVSPRGKPFCSPRKSSGTTAPTSK